MTACTFFDPATGAITQVANLSDETFAHYVESGVSALVDVRGDPGTQYVAKDASDAWALVDYTPDELAAKQGMADGWVWKMPEKVAVDARVLADLQPKAIAKTYADIDAVVWDAVGNRTEEYKGAEEAARAFAAAGYAGDVDEDVSGFAENNPTGQVQSNQWAAQQIIGRADAFSAARKSMRNQRFASQNAIRAATTNAELDAAASAWRSFIATVRTNLQLPPAS